VTVDSRSPLPSARELRDRIETFLERIIQSQ
jgi:hypothetical protein